MDLFKTFAILSLLTAEVRATFVVFRRMASVGLSEQKFTQQSSNDDWWWSECVRALSAIRVHHPNSNWLGPYTAYYAAPMLTPMV